MRDRISWVKSFTGVVVLVAVAMTSAAQSSLANHPIAGKWKLNAAKSTVGITITIAAAADGRMTMTTQGQQISFRLDGKDYPGPFDTVWAWTETGPRAWDSVSKVRGVVDSIDHLALSADGQTLTIHTELKSAAAQGKTSDAAFQRMSGGPGLPGVWKSSRLAAEATAEYSIAGDRLTVHLSPSDERWSAPLDGKDYPIAPSPSMPDGITWAGRQAGPRTIGFVLRLKGKPIQFATLTVAPDGTMLEIVQVNGASETAPDRNRLIYERQ